MAMTPSAMTSTAFVVALASQTAFITAYWILAPWWRRPAGRALMVMASGFWLVTGAQVLRHPFGLSTATSEPFTWFQIAAVSVAVAGIGWITSVLIRAQWRGRRSGRRYFDERGGGDDGEAS